MITETNSPSTPLGLFVRKHALPLFFCMAFLISWVFWFLEPSLRVRDGLGAGLLIKFGTYGPVLAAMLVAALSNSERVLAPLGIRLAAGGLVLAMAIYVNWSTAQQLRSTDGTLLRWMLLTINILLPAWVFFNAHSGLRGVQDLLHSLTRWRTYPLWFLVALFLMPVLSLAGVPLTSLLSGKPLAVLLSDIQSSETLKHLRADLLGDRSVRRPGRGGGRLARLCPAAPAEAVRPAPGKCDLGGVVGVVAPAPTPDWLLRLDLREPAQRDPDANGQYLPAGSYLHLAVQPLPGQPAGHGPAAHVDQCDLQHRRPRRGDVYYDDRRRGLNDRLRPDVPETAR